MRQNLSRQIDALRGRTRKVRSKKDRMLPRNISNPMISADYARTSEQLRECLDPDSVGDMQEQIQRHADENITYYRKLLTDCPAEVKRHFQQELISAEYLARRERVSTGDGGRGGD